MWQSFGHTTVKNLLDKQLARQLFPHAYLFVGPAGIGKKMVAEEMAAQILGAERLGNHPDYIYYNAGNDLGMDGLRQFLQQLANKPFLGQYKVAVIDNMDQANVQMSNAPLKTLEEPSSSTILFVIASQNNLLPTIVSRCQMLSFNSLTEQELMDYAKAKELKVDKPTLQASFGSPARLQLLVNDPAAAQEINQAVATLRQAEIGTTADKLLAVNALAEYETEDLKQIFLTWLYTLRQTLAQNPGQSLLMSRICESLPHLNNSFNKKMVLQRLLLHTYEIA
jgi:DNA polymerase III subunit delta'